MEEKASSQTKLLPSFRNGASSRKGREKRQQILDWLLDGYSNREIGERLGLTARGVKWHMALLFDHFDVVNRTELAAHYAMQKAQQHEGVANG